MKKLAIFFIISFLNSTFPAMSDNQEIKILYKVNENIISNIDVIKEIRYLKVLNKNFQNIELSKLKEFAIKSLIKELIKKDEIEKFYKVDYNSSDIDEYIKGLALNLKFDNISNFTNYLSQNGVQLKDVRKKLIIEKTWNSLVYEIYNQKVIINEKKIYDKIEKNINENAYQKSFKLSEIIFSADSKASFELKYKKILQEIKETNFNQAAIIHSISDTANIGGDIGWVKTSQLSKKIYAEIKNLKVEELTGPITTPSGIMILKINEIKDVPSEEIDKDLEFSKIIKNEKNRQLGEYSVIHFRKVENKSYVKKI
tara:strand:- start:2581 stop:3519 length:939 start_codon:yes stop_codon:yes gene_type:complete